MDFRLPIPKNWQDFESICHRLWSEIWNDPNAQKNGRLGQVQNGVDIVGRPIYTNQLAGVQCKDKDARLGTSLTTTELSAECEKATSFYPKISSFTLAITGPRDARIQLMARQYSEDEKIPFSVQVWAWDDIESEIVYRPAILEHFYENFVFPDSIQSTITLNRFSSPDRLHAYFSRPAIETKLTKQLRASLITLAYELSDNAYNHGKATEFNIESGERTIIFKDNGIAFNPIEDLDSTIISPSKNVGSATFDAFLLRFTGLVTPKYFRNSEHENILEFRLADNLEPTEIIEFLELEFDPRTAPTGRLAVEEFAKSIAISTDIKEIILNLVAGCGWAPSQVLELILGILRRLDSTQRLIVYLPREDPYLFEMCSNRFKDERITFYIR